MVKQVFIDNAPLAEAKREFINILMTKGSLEILTPELVPVHESLERITHQAVRARICSPHYHAAAMDGFAVKACDTFGASEANPYHLEIGLDAKVVDTGDPLPEGFDAVIKMEDVSFPCEQLIEITLGAVPWQHVRVMGEDLVATEMLLPANHRIRPVDIGILFAGGLTEVAARRKPKVAVLPTGTELVYPGDPLEKGSIIDFNSHVLSAMLSELGAEPVRYPITHDNYDLLNERIAQAAAQADIVIVNAGSSAGREDFTASLIEDLGEVFTHGVAIRPGKPVILGMVNRKPVVGLPGYPVSAVLTFQLFVQPLIAAKLGITIPVKEVQATLTRKLVSFLGVDEFVRIKLGQVGEKLTATPLSRGAGLVSSLVRADGVVQVNRLSEGYLPGDSISVRLLRPISEIVQTAVAIGSHDPALDILGDCLHSNFPAYYLSSAHVGSLNGLMALRRGEAHVAGVHLLDEATGEYNCCYVEKLLNTQRGVLVNMAYRSQGLIVAKGNPKGIKGLADLARDDVEFINRQGGSGTRMLLDFRLKQEGVNPDHIQGYYREEFTHMAVAAAVEGGAADCGLGVWSAAQALGLKFIPVAEERFDLCIVDEFMYLAHIKAMLDVLNSSQFKDQVTALGGYDLRDSGQIMN